MIGVDWEIITDGVDVYTASFLNGVGLAGRSVASFAITMLGRGPHKNCKNDLDDQT